MVAQDALDTIFGENGNVQAAGNHACQGGLATPRHPGEKDQGAVQYVAPAST
jgi:hypothetical protein